MTVGEREFCEAVEVCSKYIASKLKKSIEDRGQEIDIWSNYKCLLDLYHMSVMAPRSDKNYPMFCNVTEKIDEEIRNVKEDVDILVRGVYNTSESKTSRDRRPCSFAPCCCSS